jgi:nascent polypeptide-associated complex subunit alpha
MPPSINPAQMRKMMQRMGIQQVEIDAEAVIIKTADKDIIITEPSVTKVNAMGQETFQISGRITERSREPEISDEDVKTVMDGTGVDRDTAVAALKKNDYDLAKAIMDLSPK